MVYNSNDFFVYLLLCHSNSLTRAPAAQQRQERSEILSEWTPRRPRRNFSNNSFHTISNTRTDIQCYELRDQNDICCYLWRSSICYCRNKFCYIVYNQEERQSSIWNRYKSIIIDPTAKLTLIL